MDGPCRAPKLVGEITPGFPRYGSGGVEYEPGQVGRLVADAKAAGRRKSEVAGGRIPHPTPATSITLHQFLAHYTPKPQARPVRSALPGLAQSLIPAEPFVPAQPGPALPGP